VSGLPILYSFRRCPYAMRARLAIAASGRRCELREVVLRDKPPALLQASPKATVPVLVLPDGTVLEESLDIMLWALRLHDPQGWLTPERGGLDAMLALIRECDECFKPRLDRYKYPQRFELERDALTADDGRPATGADDGSSGISRSGDDVSGSEGGVELSLWTAGHRDAGARWLEMLEARLAQSACLFGERSSLADMAIAPFVRQYAHVDRGWFETRSWTALRAWLDAWMKSDLFARVMAKYRPWSPEAPAELFP